MLSVGDAPKRARRSKPEDGALREKAMTVFCTTCERYFKLRRGLHLGAIFCYECEQKSDIIEHNVHKNTAIFSIATCVVLCAFGKNVGNIPENRVELRIVIIFYKNIGERLDNAQNMM